MRSFLVGLAVVVLSGCQCGPNVNATKPELLPSPLGLDFNEIKVGGQATRSISLDAKTNTSVTISRMAIEGADATAFSVVPVTSVSALSSEPAKVTFKPTAVRAFQATLVVESNDATTPTRRLPLIGAGAAAKIEVTPTCRTAAPDNCKGSVVTTPPSIDFGMEPLVRTSPLPVTQLPLISVVNAGTVELLVTKVAIEGADAASFLLEQVSAIPSEGLPFDPSQGFNFRVRFRPMSATQSTYAATAVIESDDPDHPRVTIALTGTLIGNQPPVVCANLVRVVPPADVDAPRDYGTQQQWAPLLTVPDGGYDFSLTRDVRPGETVQLSAISDSATATACTTDPEDGRAALIYSWRLVTSPRMPAPGLSGANSSQVTLRPAFPGEYVLELSVKDARMAETVVRLKFVAAVKQDFVAQLDWAGYANVDLDLHLVRPSSSTGDAFSGAFGFFDDNAGRTSGDLNGYAKRLAATSGGRYDFDWGDAGSADNPVLTVDDTGSGDLIESVALNYPEADPLCATAPCTYKVMAHYFKDLRPLPTEACFVDGGTGCADGEACACSMGGRCVATALDGGVGAGRCFDQPKPVVRFYFRGNPTPAATIPVPPSMLTIGAPCQMLYLADVIWPARTSIGSLPDGGSPPAIVRAAMLDGGMTVAPFGRRSVGQDLQCTPNDLRAMLGWYARQ